MGLLDESDAILQQKEAQRLAALNWVDPIAEKWAPFITVEAKDFASAARELDLPLWRVTRLDALQPYGAWPVALQAGRSVYDMDYPNMFGGVAVLSNGEWRWAGQTRDRIGPLVQEFEKVTFHSRRHHELSDETITADTHASFLKALLSLRDGTVKP